MSEFYVEVVNVGPIEKHPNADTLGITKVRDYPVIVKLGEFKEGSLAIYIPVDSVLPDDQRWDFLGVHKRIKAKRLRGIFSMGLLAKAEPEWIEGQNVANELSITKYEPPEPVGFEGENERNPGMPTYTDISGLRRWPDILHEGEEVVVTEKIHGSNGRWLWYKDRLWCGSHSAVKKENPQNLWWKAAHKYDLASRLSKAPEICIYAEVFGQVQELKYGAGKGEIFIAMFDAADIKTGVYLDYQDLESIIKRLDLPPVPKLYQGLWSRDLRSLAEGESIWPGANHVKEGIVVRPVKERWDERIGRVILKLHGEKYLLKGH